ncbi:hypothetical protein F2Q69_00015528 [Brassica cretica]|uniref:Glycosyl hydrolase family 32 N-terminal domain-containing protein n=1 Tax=Brassica cretica TaxID=69181 RepID=A0A8S9R9C4_BRACR|nr:hypothetical protein F2Q69_00015528 [Brassica cretica]
MQSKSTSLEVVSHLHRTGFHFQPPRHWINGPMVYKGIYHLFYQYNPKGAVWGNIVWAHSVSKDLINWEALEPAIYPSKWFDINGTWSGSATNVPGKGPVILYTEQRINGSFLYDKEKREQDKASYKAPEPLRYSLIIM